jgi:hypothetical protein
MTVLLRFNSTDLSVPFITELIPRGERWRLIGRHTAKTGNSLVKLTVTFSGHWLRRDENAGKIRGINSVMKGIVFISSMFSL